MVSKFSWWDQLRATVIAFLLLHFEIEAVTVSSYNPCVACWEILPRCNLECCRMVGICILRVGTSAADSYTPLPLLLSTQPPKNPPPPLLLCCAPLPPAPPPWFGVQRTHVHVLPRDFLPAWLEGGSRTRFIFLPTHSIISSDNIGSNLFRFR